MNPAQQTLWEKILHFELNDPQAAFPFVQRLAMENGWKLSFAFRAILEYKRFMYLCCVSPTPMTPSDEVDQVWHLHLIYTRSYWQDFCRYTLQREIHHGPTKGGKTEDTKYNDAYENTLTLYHEHFAQVPPTDLWPPAKIRFAPMNFRRVNLNQYWLFPKIFTKV